MQLANFCKIIPEPHEAATVFSEQENIVIHALNLGFT